MSMSRLFLQSVLLPPALLLLSCGDVPIDEAAPQSDETGEASEQAPRLPEPMRVEGPMPQAPVSEAAIDCNVAPTTRKDLVCWRWRCDRMNRSEGSWSGNLASCNAGDISTAGRQNALKLVNLYRFLGGLPAVTTDATKNAAAQKCALMQHANGTLSHTPPTTWKCYSADGASAAGRSNIAGAAGVGAVDLYMADSGNPTTIGHRRWILSRSLGPIGLGSTLAGTTGYSCMHVIGGSGAASYTYQAWPPPGPVPIEMFNAVSFAPLDVVGWTVQSDTINLSGATATLKDGSTVVPTTTTTLASGYGSIYAIRFAAKSTGWRAQAGRTYNVTITKTGMTSITYAVQPTACP